MNSDAAEFLILFGNWIGRARIKGHVIAYVCFGQCYGRHFGNPLLLLPRRKCFVQQYQRLSSVHLVPGGQERP